VLGSHVKPEAASLDHIVSSRVEALSKVSENPEVPGGVLASSGVRRLFALWTLPSACMVDPPEGRCLPV